MVRTVPAAAAETFVRLPSAVQLAATQIPLGRDGLYPAIEPHLAGLLDVGQGQKVYYEVSGNRDGKPVLFCHGGPGSCTSPKQRRLFNPELYRIVLWDQLACGKSTPYGSLENNTTPRLVECMEQLRGHLGVDRWQVFGGSWGSTLALIYGALHPERVTELVLRGLFFGSTFELDWFYQGVGAANVFPDLWKNFVECIPEAERGDLRDAYYRRLTSDDEATRLEAAKRWCLWEAGTIELVPRADLLTFYGDPHHAVAMALIESHFFRNECFMEGGARAFVYNHLDVLRRIPATLVHGRYDQICPVVTAFELKDAWPELELIINPRAGHGAWDLQNTWALTKTTDLYAGLDVYRQTDAETLSNLQ